jgi:hypothetical protein
MNDARDERHLMTDADRQELDAHYRAIAAIYVRKRIWRNLWSVDVDGCRVKFKIDGYARHGTPIWKEQQAELAESIREFHERTEKTVNAQNRETKK